MTFWTGKRILITGARGFVGTHLAEALLHTNGASVVSPEWIDLRERLQVAHLFNETRPDVVFHCAARVGGIGANRAHPTGFYRDNVLINAAIVDEATNHPKLKLITLGSVCAYPKYTPVPFKEESLWMGYPEETNAPYGISKRALLVHLQAAREEYGLNGIMLIPTNLYGPGDHFEDSKSHVIPALIKRICAAKAAGDKWITVWGTGRATRDFLYVKDAVKAIIAAAEQYDDPAPLNIGSGVEYSIASLVAILQDQIGYTGQIEWDSGMPDGQPRRVLDSTAARIALGWTATTDIRDGLRQTLNWYLERTHARLLHAVGS